MLLAVICAVIIFHIKLSLELIWPTNTSVLFHGDWAQHYLSWEFFRTTPWQFPLGTLEGYAYPLVSNIGYTDSIPLLAFILKPFSSFLPNDFQYIGIWLLSCFILQAVFAFLILRSFKIEHPLSLFFGTMLFVLSPVLLFRVGHPALCAQWMILGSFWIYFKNADKLLLSIISQLALVLLASFVHPYLALMILGCAVAYFFRLLFVEKKINLLRLILLLSSAGFIMLLAWIVIGYNSLPLDDAWLTGGSFTNHSANLLSFFNPLEYSTILPNIPLRVAGQREGFAYLGLGIILLLIISVAGLTINRIKKVSLANNVKTWLWFTPIGIVALVFFFFSLSTTIDLGSVTLIDIPLPKWSQAITDTLRATGRFSWILYYLLIVTILYVISRFRFHSNIVTILLAGALVIQIMDIYPLLIRNYGSVGRYESSLSSEWEEIVKDATVIIMFHPYQADYLEKDDYIKFVYLAHQQQIPITTGYLARYDISAREAYSTGLRTAFMSGEPQHSALYITTPEFEYEFQPWLEKNLVRKQVVDGYSVYIPD